MDNELQHYGVKGMKWGVRRYRAGGPGGVDKVLGRKKKTKLKLKKGNVNGKTLAEDILNSLGVAAIANLAGSAMVANGQLEAGENLKVIGGLFATGMLAGELINRTSVVKK